MKIYNILCFCILLICLFTLNCDVLINPTPEMIVKHGSTEIPTDSGIYDFGRVEVNRSSTAIFTIENNGNTDLKLTGSPMIAITGTDSSNFIVSEHPSTPILLDSDTTFSIKFMPTDSREYSTIVSISNNDADANPYTFTLTGRGIIIDINIRQGTQNIPIDSGMFDFGSIYLRETSPEYTFSIENVGSAILHLTGSPDLIVISGSDKGMFTIDQTLTSTPIEPGDSTTFTITFTPTSIGTKTAKIIIANNDSDENPYIFTIKGTGIAKEPKFDFNGDGINDVIIGTKSNNENIGNAYIFFGNMNHETYVNAKDADVVLTGEEKRDDFGKSVACAGDFNGDGFDDVIIGSTIDIPYGHNSRVFIFFGSKNPPANLSFKDADVSIYSEDIYSYFGNAVSSAGDFNKDGFDDVIIGSENSQHNGCAFIFFGSSEPTPEIYVSDADVIIHGESRSDDFGVSVSYAGDFNADGFDDVIIGTQVFEETNKMGYAALVLGRINPSLNINAEDYDVRFNASVIGDYFGYHVSNAGDFNNDGFDDVVIGAENTKDFGNHSGSIFVYFGSSNPSRIIETDGADMKIIGEKEDMVFGKYVSTAGDYNNDGFDDLAVSTMTDDLGARIGCIFMYYGKKNPDKVNISSIVNVKFNGELSSGFGEPVSTAGDYNLDGIDDLLIGARGSNENGYRSGSAYIFYGALNPEADEEESRPDLHFYGEKERDEFGYSVSGGK